MAFIILVVLSYPIHAWLFLEVVESLRIDQAIEAFDAGFPSSNEPSAINSPYSIASAYLSLFVHLKLSSRGTTEPFTLGAIRVGLSLLLLSSS